MQIIKGKIQTAKKVVIYGSEGIGKSTFASQFPNPLYLDTEGSTKEMDVARFPKANSWAMLLEQINYIKNNPNICKTLVIDTIDWAEQMCIEAVCAKHQKRGIEDFGYGNGYVYTKEEFGRFLNQLEDIVEKGIHALLTAHAQIRKFEQPDELGAYDRYELKLGKKTASQTSPLIKEWADMVLFANYKTHSIAVDEKGKKHKAQGGRRVMYTAHHPCWDAKNRFNLPEELPFEYASIAFIFEKKEKKEESKPEPLKAEESKPESPVETAQEEPKSPEPPKKEAIPKPPKEQKAEEPPEGIPKTLWELMQANQICEWDIQAVVTQKGYYPANMTIKDYDPTFIDGVLIGAWAKVHMAILAMKDNLEIPFD